MVDSDAVDYAMVCADHTYRIAFLYCARTWTTVIQAPMIMPIQMSPHDIVPDATYIVPCRTLPLNAISRMDPDSHSTAERLKITCGYS